MTKYFDDHEIGEKMRHGIYSVTREEVLDFACQFARPIEVVDNVTPIRTSGCHTLSIFQRMQIDMGFANESAAAMLAAVGMDEVRWLTPVFSGDTLAAEFEVLDKIKSNSKPDRGILKIRYTLYNQAGAGALTLISLIMIKRRPDGE